MRNLLALDDRALRNIAANPIMRQRFSFVSAAAEKLSAKPRCGRCPAKKRAELSQIMKEFRRQISALRGTELSDFKRISGAKSLRLVVPNSQGKLVNLTM